MLSCILIASEIALSSGDVHRERNVFLNPFPNTIDFVQESGIAKLEIKIMPVGTGAEIMLNEYVFSLQPLRSSWNVEGPYLFHVAITPIRRCSNDFHVFIPNGRLCEVCLFMR